MMAGNARYMIRKSIARAINNKATRKNTLRAQLLLVLILVSLIPVVAIGTSTYITTIGKITDLSLNRLKADTINTKNNIDVKINSIDSIIKGVSSQPDFLVALEKVNNSGVLETVIYSNIQLSMKNAVEGSNKLIEAMYLCGVDGRIIAAGAKNYKIFKDKAFYNPKVFENLKRLSRDKVIVGEPYYSNELKKMTIPISKPVNSLAAFSGSLTALVDYNSFFSFISNISDENETLVLGKDQISIFNPDRDKINIKFTNSELQNYLTIGAAGEYHTYYDNKTKKVMYIDKSDNADWSICVQTEYSTVMSSVTQYLLVISAVILFTLVITLVVSISYSKHISTPVTELAEQMKNIEEGFLEIQLNNSNVNIFEIKSLRNNFQNMAQKLKELISGISSAAKEIDCISEVMYETACYSIEQSQNTGEAVTKIGENITKQAMDTDYAAQGIESLASQIAESKELAQNMSSYLGLLNSSTENGKTQIKTLEYLSEVNQRNTDKLNEMVTQLQQQMKQINSITTTIQSIAKQTHLLSLNATIEAGRAGEAGKGFTVVAQEIKALSEQANLQAGSIRKMLAGIVANTNCLIETFRDVNRGIESQGVSVNRTISSFEEITEFIDNINSQLSNFNSHLQEMDFQKNSLVQLVKDINTEAFNISRHSMQVQSYTEQQLDTVKKVHGNSSHFHNLAGDLNKSVELFRI